MVNSDKSKVEFHLGSTDFPAYYLIIWILFGWYDFDQAQSSLDTFISHSHPVSSDQSKHLKKINEILPVINKDIPLWYSGQEHR